MIKFQIAVNAIIKSGLQIKPKYHRRSKQQIDSWKDNIYDKRFILAYRNKRENRFQRKKTAEQEKRKPHRRDSRTWLTACGLRRTVRERRRYGLTLLNAPAEDDEEEITFSDYIYDFRKDSIISAVSSLTESKDETSADEKEMTNPMT